MSLKLRLVFSTTDMQVQHIPQEDLLVITLPSPEEDIQFQEELDALCAKLNSEGVKQSTVIQCADQINRLISTLVGMDYLRDQLLKE